MASSMANIGIFFLFLNALFIFLQSSSSISNGLFFPFRFNIGYHNSTSVDRSARVGDDLDAALSEASRGNDDKTVIISGVNKAYVELNLGKSVGPATTMLDVFLESFWMGEETRPLLENMLVVAVDDTAYQRCRFRGLHCYKLETDGVDSTGEAMFMSKDFIEMMWTRTAFLLDVLKRGYSFIFTDMDAMWLRNPFTRLSKNKSYDIEISTDMIQKNAGPEKQLINTGLYYIRSNNKTISLFEKWLSMKDKSTGMKEQDVLIRLLRQGFMGQLGIKMRFLDTLYFSGFCEDSRDVGAVVTVHANCCQSISAKVSDLSNVLGDWQRAKEVGVGNGTNGFGWTPHVECVNSWNIPNDNN